MKRTAAVMLIVFTVMLLFGCAVKNETQTDDGSYCFDYNVRTISTLGKNSIIELKDAILFLKNGMMYYSEKATKDFLPLCTRPNCGHNSADCEANFEAQNFTVWNDMIYYVDGLWNEELHPDEEYEPMKYPSLWRASLDGTKHEKLMDLPAIDTDFVPIANSCGLFFTNKYLAVFYTVMSDYELGRREHDSYVIDLKTLKTRKIDTASLGYPYTTIAPMAGRDESLYVTSIVDTGFERIKQLCRLDCSTGVMELIGRLPDDIFIYEFSFLLMEDSIRYLVWTLGSNDYHCYSSDLNTGEYTELSSGSLKDIKWGQFDWQNGKMFSCYVRMHSEWIDETKPYWGFYYLNSDFEEEDCFLYGDEADKLSGITAAFQTENYIFGIEQNEDGIVSIDSSFPTWYIDKNDVGTGRLMWRRWEP